MAARNLWWEGRKDGTGRKPYKSSLISVLRKQDEQRGDYSNHPYITYPLNTYSESDPSNYSNDHPLYDRGSLTHQVQRGERKQVLMTLMTHSLTNSVTRTSINSAVSLLV